VLVVGELAFCAAGSSAVLDREASPDHPGRRRAQSRLFVQPSTDAAATGAPGSRRERWSCESRRRLAWRAEAALVNRCQRYRSWQDHRRDGSFGT
jgi:hypothetical protein